MSEEIAATWYNAPVEMEPHADAVTFASEDVPDVDLRIAHFVGTDKSVLLLAVDGDALAEVLRNNNCQVSVETIVPSPPAQPNIEDAVGDRRFDVVIAVEALEYLPNPRPFLEQLKALLQPGGYVITVLPNIAHGSIRLALLGGSFPTFRAGRMHDGVCRHHFTRDLLVRLLESAGYAIGYLERHEMAIKADEDVLERGTCSEELLQALGRDPDARTARFMCVAIPIPWPGMHWLQHRLRQLGDQRERAEREARALGADLETVTAHLTKLLRVQEDSLAREKELRCQLLDAHHRLAAREREIHEVRKESLAREKELEGRLAVQEREICEAARRLDRFRHSVPGRAYRFVRKVVHRLVG